MRDKKPLFGKICQNIRLTFPKGGGWVHNSNHAKNFEIFESWVTPPFFLYPKNHKLNLLKIMKPLSIHLFSLNLPLASIHLNKCYFAVHPYKVIAPQKRATLKIDKYLLTFE